MNDLSVKVKTVNLLEENRDKSSDLEFGKVFLVMTSKAQVVTTAK